LCYRKLKKKKYIEIKIQIRLQKTLIKIKLIINLKNKNIRNQCQPQNPVKINTAAVSNYKA
jgi:hypothetical protein